MGSGWEFDVFVTTDCWAFRFPRRAEYQSWFEREEPVLALARSVLPPETAVPLVELIGASSLEILAPLTTRFHERPHYAARLQSVMWLGLAQQEGRGVGRYIVWVENAFSTEGDS